MIDAAEINQRGILGFERVDHRREVGAFFGAFEAENIDAELFRFVAKIVRDALAVKRLVVNDVDRFRFQLLGGETRADWALDIVAAADAIDIRITAIGDLGGGIGRRDHRQHGVLVNFRRRQRDAGIKMSDDHQDFGIGDHVARVGDADFRFRLVVLGHQHEIVAQRFERLDRLLDGELGAEFDMFAERGLLARKRRLHGDLDFTFLCPGSCRQRGKQREQEN